jgi:hypothetical protein
MNIGQPHPSTLVDAAILGGGGGHGQGSGGGSADQRKSLVERTEDDMRRRRIIRDAMSGSATKRAVRSLATASLDVLALNHSPAHGARGGGGCAHVPSERLQLDVNGTSRRRVTLDGGESAGALRRHSAGGGSGYVGEPLTPPPLRSAASLDCLDSQPQWPASRGVALNGAGRAVLVDRGTV